VQPDATSQGPVAYRQLGDAASDRADLQPIRGIGKLAAGEKIVTGDGDTVPAPDQAGPELEHQPHTPATARLTADVMVDKRDVHCGKSRAVPYGPAPTIFAGQRDADGPISSARMVSTLPANGDPALAGSSEDVHVDILDTSAAGPSVIRGSMLRLGGYGLGTLATVSDLGLTGFAVREYATEPRSDGRRFLRNLLGIRIALALSGLLAAIVFGLLVGYPAVMVLG